MAFIGLPILVAAIGQMAGALPVLVGNIVTSLLIIPAAVAVLSSRAPAAVGGRLSPARNAWSVR